MELGWEARPLSLAHHVRDWRSQQGAGPSSAPPSSFSPASALPHRRRSSATQVPPPVPPPNQPIPRVPNSPSTSPVFNTAQYFPQINRTANTLGQPSATTIQTRLNSVSNPPQPSPSSLIDLSDPPPPPMLQVSPLSQNQATLLLSPPRSRPRSDQRPSSRRALTQALELAKEAVKLDSTNNDPLGAVVAYGRSVALLSEVMERVRRGEDSTETARRRRNGRRRSVVAQEEEVKRLKSIHDTYADRMNILSLIYSIPPIPHSPSSIYASTIPASTDPTSPDSNSPSSDVSDPYTPADTIDSRSEDLRQLPDNSYPRRGNDEQSDAEAIGSAMFAGSWDATSQLEPENVLSPDRTASLSHSSSPYHPYAAVEFSPPPTISPSPNIILPISRTSSLPSTRRPRTSSILPPPPPPPQNSLPPAPTPVWLDQPLDPSSSQVPRRLDIGRTQEDTVTGHKRTASGSRLTALKEEIEKYDGRSIQQQPYPGDERDVVVDQRNPQRNLVPDTPRTAKRDSPLPALPSPSSSTSVPDAASDTPTDKAPPSPRSSNVAAFRPGGSSTQPYLINTSTTMGTIYKRRSKASAPPSTGSSSPTEPTASVPVVAAGYKLTASSLSSNTATSLGIGRTRALSQPGGRRPSLINGRISPLDPRPPLPATAGLNPSTVPRKPSIPSKLNPNSQTNAQVDSAFSPGGVPPSGVLMPMPRVSQRNLPTTPTSPLPPAPPTDALRKPYHLMNLLQTTMTSKTGGYVTRRLHIPQEVWSQGGAKLTNVLEKVRVVEVLCAALEDLQSSSVEYFGAGNVSSGLALGIGSVGRKEGEAWLGKLEDFSSVCDGVVANFGKKLGVGEGFVLKKTSGVTSWGGKLTRQLDKFTNGKNLDSPAAYVLGLSRLFTHAQLLDEHTRALSNQPASATYAAFPPDVRVAAETKLKRSSEFFASVVLTFVIRDLSQLLDKYAKKCEKWLVE